MVSVLESIYMMHRICGFSYVKPSLLLWNEADLTMISDTLNMFKNFACHVFY